MEKLKALIVDDEHLIRKLIRMRINWEQEGFEIAGEASNAQEAMELVEQQKPDVILTDIYMPVIDGIEFSRSVMEKHPQIKIVVVSGHDEFEYAQQSIKIGVFDFLLKPIRAADLLHVTRKLKQKIEEERSREGELARLKEELARNLPYLREKFLLQWLQGTLSREEIREQAEYFQLPAFRQESPYQIAVVEITPLAEKHTEEQLILLGMACKRKMELFFQGDPFVTTLSDTRNQFVLISFRPEGDLARICEALINRLTGSPKGLVTIGIGRKRHRLQEGHLGYQEACSAIRYKAFVGNNQVICYEDMVDSREETYRSNPELLRQLQFYISVGSSDRAAEMLEHIFDVAFSSVSQFRMAAMDVIHECQRAAMEQQLEGEQGLDKETLVSIITADNLPELVQTLKGYILTVSEAIHARRQTKEGNLIHQVQAYLEQNLGDPGVGLASTAAAFFVSPGHLGRLMKKETGQTFVEYLTNLRMKKAEGLLKTTDLKGYEIGEQVGITDPHYFSILFKKSTGRSMNEYRNAR
ncbi:response regulator [Paenibacillus rubinfantis]|uniref:response regulator n=1 Tax=Paenibacillus rubinfantis TaxID=1720296 RepID=UPI00073E54F5|nr:response regulator [Paenibacillus rubinfantis]